MLSEYHMAAFTIGFVMDLLFGDPYWLPHPIRWIGRLIGWLDRKLLGETDGAVRNEAAEKKKGKWLVAFVLLPVLFFAAAVLFVAYQIHPAAGVVTESVMTYQMLATKCLKTESMKVYKRLLEHDLCGARKAVSMIVGRDTECLDEEGVAKAAIETVAENASDGVIAPMLYLALFGPVGGFFYKAVNTMDSMVGYKNDRYHAFGTAAAMLDDVVNFIPARISAMLMILSCCFLGNEFDQKNAMKIFKRDRYQHASPNSAQTEAACAGALGIRLAGDASYFGRIVKKPYIGDPLRAVETEDIRRANRLLYGMAFFGWGICMAVWLCVTAIVW